MHRPTVQQQPIQADDMPISPVQKISGQPISKPTNKRITQAEFNKPIDLEMNSYPLNNKSLSGKNCKGSGRIKAESKTSRVRGKI